MQFKLVNILKQTIKENYGDLLELTFKNIAYSPKYDNVFFNKIDGDLSSLSTAMKIKLIDAKTGDEYSFDSNKLNTTRKGDSLKIKMQDFKISYPQQAEKLYNKEEIKSNENLDVNTLKTKASGVPETILNALKEVYPNNWGRINEPNCETLDGVIDIFPAIEGERWSILNFFDTNPGVIGLIVKKYKDESDTQTQEGFKQWITDNKEELFGEDSPFLQNLIRRNKQSFENGWKLESDVIDIIKKENPSLKDEDIIQYCLGSVKDRVGSIDVSVKGKGYQIKPSNKMERLRNGSIKVYTHGMKNWYKNKVKNGLNYIIYSNGKNIAVFPNEKYWVSDDGKTAIHHTKMVPNPFV